MTIDALVGAITRTFPTVDARAEMGADLVVRCGDLPDREVVVWVDWPRTKRPFRFVASSGGVGCGSSGRGDGARILQLVRRHFRLFEVSL